MMHNDRRGNVYFGNLALAEAAAAGNLNARTKVPAWAADSKLTVSLNGGSILAISDDACLLRVRVGDSMMIGSIRWIQYCRSLPSVTTKRIEVKFIDHWQCPYTPLEVRSCGGDKSTCQHL